MTGSSLFNDVVPQEQRARQTDDAARVLREDLERALTEVHEKYPNKTYRLAQEIEQMPRDWRDAEIARLKAELAVIRKEHQAELAQLRADFGSRKAGSRAFHSEVDPEAAQIRAELVAITSSTSWRLTAPLRAALDMLRHLRHRR